MTLFLADTAGPFEDTRVGTVCLGVTIEKISTNPSKETGNSPFFAAVEAFSVIATTFRSGGALTSHMSGFATAVLCQH